MGLPFGSVTEITSAGVNVEGSTGPLKVTRTPGRAAALPCIWTESISSQVVRSWSVLTTMLSDWTRYVVSGNVMLKLTGLPGRLGSVPVHRTWTKPSVSVASTSVTKPLPLVSRMVTPSANRGVA